MTQAPDRPRSPESAPVHRSGGARWRWEAGGQGVVVPPGTRWLLSLSLPVRMALGIALLAGMAMLDAGTGSEISFSIFYLLPVSFAGAFISRRAGLVFAVVSAASWGYLEVATGPAFSAVWIPYWNSLVRLGFFVLVNELIARLRRAHARERALAREDSLTGIANTRVFDEQVQRAIATGRRSGRPFTLAYLDLDGFKQVNDRFGHSEGDRLLRSIAKLMSEGVRATDVVARLGGDEFGVLMPDTGAEQARISLSRLAEGIEKGMDDRWAVGATIGAVTFTRPPADVDSAVGEADALMYRGKGEGRGRILQAIWPAQGVGDVGPSG
jgi:diguanylate cyclase (GGDEF)-like protein